MTSLTLYYDVTNPSTMTSLILYYDVTGHQHKLKALLHDIANPLPFHSADVIVFNPPWISEVVTS